MEVEQSNPSIAMNSDEVSMERSKSFVTALQELKNLRPQLYSAAEYCEKSYLHNEEKQMVLDNLKDYAVRALVNAVDHLGTVAYKLTNLLEQQTSDISSVDLKITCLDQQLLTCQTYTEREGIRQHQLLPIVPRHHKHYILPNSAGKKAHFGPHVQTDTRQLSQGRSRLFPSGTPAAKTLSWHLASETKSTLRGGPRAFMSPEDAKVSGKAHFKFNLLGDGIGIKSPATHPHSSGVGPASSVDIRSLGVLKQDKSEAMAVVPFGSLNNPTRRQIIRAPPRRKNLLAAFFVRHKAMKMKTSAVS